jgi:hypothetical protein
VLEIVSAFDSVLVIRLFHVKTRMLSVILIMTSNSACLWRKSLTDEIIVFRPYYNEIFVIQTASSIGSRSCSSSAIKADVNDDHHLNFAIFNSSRDNIAVFIVHGDAALRSMAFHSNKSKSVLSQAILDYSNNDGFSDINVGHRDSDYVGVLLGYGNSTFEVVVNFATLTRSHLRCITMNSLNHDGYLAIIIANQDRNNLTVPFSHENGSFGNTEIYSTGSDSLAHSTGIGNFIHDTWLSMSVPNYGYDDTSLLLGSGNERFTHAISYSTE